MKKIILLFCSVLLVCSGFSSKAFGATETEVEVKKQVDCPPSYVGQKKCFVIENPKTKNKTVVKKSVQIPKKPVRKLPSGREVGTDIYYYIAGALGLTLAATGAGDGVINEIDNLRNNQEKMEKFATDSAASLSEKSAESLAKAWDDVKESKNSFMELSSVVWNEVIGSSAHVLSEDEIFRRFLDGKLVAQQDFTGTSLETLLLSNVGTVGYAVRFELSAAYDVYVPLLVNGAWLGDYKYSYTTFRAIGSNNYTSIDYGWAEIQGTYDSKAGKITSYGFPRPYLSYEEAKAMFFSLEPPTDDPDHHYVPYSGRKYTLDSTSSNPWSGAGSSIGTNKLYVPPSYHGTVSSPSTESQVQVEEYPGETFIEVPNEADPSLEPDLQPLPQKDESGLVKIPPTVPGTKIITEDGEEIKEDGSTGEKFKPIFPVLPSPGTGTGTDTDTDKDSDPDSKPDGDTSLFPDWMADPTKLFVPAQPIGSYFEPVLIDFKTKFNTPGDFKFLAPSITNGCKNLNDIYVTLFGHKLKIVDMSIVVEMSKWFKPIISGFFWFGFGWWLFRRMNILASKNGGVTW